MILDASAVLAILLEEPEAERFSSAVGDVPTAMSVATWLECQVVVDRRMPHLGADLRDVLACIAPRLIEVDIEQARVAREAHRRYGTRSGSSAHLNFGDCFAYALAITRGEPLLFKGEDFTHTDVLPAL